MVGLRMRRGLAVAGGRTAPWTNCNDVKHALVTGQIMMVKPNWSNQTGQTKLLTTNWSNQTGQTKLVRPYAANHTLVDPCCSPIL